MLFNSYEFLLVFLPVVLVVYYALPRALRAPWLTVASYVFYGWWRVDCVGLMFGLTALNFAGGWLVGRSSGRGMRRLWLGLSVAGSLGVLGFFKYADFVLWSWNAAVTRLGVGEPTGLLGVLLPVGISFYTFQSMSYPLDVYRGVCRPTRRFLDFACYVSLFPQLIAGPIVRYNEIADQLTGRRHTAEKVGQGMVLFTLGLAKKVLVADALAPVAAAAFGPMPGGGFAEILRAARDVPAPGAALAWLALVAYAFQIYFDFSGYSDMAIGLGLMLGFEFPQNFNVPYQATGFRDFWRRWHMSLSRFLRDYLYISLGGNRRGGTRTYVNVMVTMLLGGLWHGANWTFLLWGGYHGVLVCIERALGERNPLARLPRAAKVAGTFLMVTLGWVLFRSLTLGNAGQHAAALVGAHGLGTLPAAATGWPFLAAFGVAVVATWTLPSAWAWRPRLGLRTLAWALPLFLLSLYGVLTSAYSPFLYFQF